jgi:hypothetical protein
VEDVVPKLILVLLFLLFVFFAYTAGQMGEMTIGFAMGVVALGCLWGAMSGGKKTAKATSGSSRK